MDALERGRAAQRIADLARRDALEQAAKIAESHATCSCEGRSGRCLENDGPRAIAAEIRTLITKEDGNG